MIKNNDTHTIKINPRRTVMKSSSKINSDFEVNNGKTYYIKAYNEKCREWQYDDLYPRIMNVKS